jgi:hypothetical protein
MRISRGLRRVDLGAPREGLDGSLSSQEVAYTVRLREAREVASVR